MPTDVYSNIRQSHPDTSFDALLSFSKKFAEEEDIKSANLCFEQAKRKYKSLFGSAIPEEAIKPVEDLISRKLSKKTKEHILRCLDEQGYFFLPELPPEYRKVTAASCIKRLKKSGIIEEEWFSIPDRTRGSSRKVIFPKGRVSEDVLNSMTCEDCERPYFSESDDEKTIEMGYLEGKMIKAFNPEDYGTEFDTREFDMVGTKGTKVKIYFRKGCVPSEMEDIFCKGCQKPYFSVGDIEGIALVETRIGIGKLNPPIYI